MPMTAERKREYNRAYRAKHRDKLVARSKAYYADNKDRFADTNLQRNYGITLEQREARSEAQGHACAICGTIEPAGRGNRLHVDHCHDTNKVRELLCMECNTGIGKLRTPELLRAAAAYLEKHK